MAGGKRMNFRACVAIGDRNGKIGLGVAKGSDVSLAVNKAVNKAKKNMLRVELDNESIPHVVRYKLGAASIVFKPAKQGRGVIAGGVVRVILELAGIKNVTSKILGTNSKINNARCTFAALASLRPLNKKTKKSKLESKDLKEGTKSKKDSEAKEEKKLEKKDNKIKK